MLYFESMKKPLTGILIALFCLFGLVGISQNKGLPEPAPLYVLLGLGAVSGLIMALRSRRSSGKPVIKTTSAAKPGGRPTRKTPRTIYLVKLPKARDYVVPKVCCTCLGEADGAWPVSCRHASWRYSLNIPFCKTCSKTKYPWWTYRTPVSLDVDPKSDQMLFGFDNGGYAREFARLNGGTVLEGHV